MNIGNDPKPEVHLENYKLIIRISYQLQDHFKNKGKFFEISGIRTDFGNGTRTEMKRCWIKIAGLKICQYLNLVPVPTPVYDRPPLYFI